MARNHATDFFICFFIDGGEFQLNPFLVHFCGTCRVALQSSTDADGGYTIIGTSADSVVEHPELGTAAADGVPGQVPVVPSYIFYASRPANDHPNIPGPYSTDTHTCMHASYALMTCSFFGFDLFAGLSRATLTYMSELISSGTPTECVLARNYSKGLVLIRTCTHTGNSDFENSVEEVQLNG